MDGKGGGRGDGGEVALSYERDVLIFIAFGLVASRSMIDSFRPSPDVDRSRVLLRQDMT